MLANCGVNGVATISGCFFPLLVTLIFWLISFAGTVAVVFIIISGIRFITSGGDAKQLDQARKTLAYAILGLILIFLAFFIINFIATTTGVVCISKISSGVIPTFTSCQ